MDKCIYCGSTQLIRNVKLGLGSGNVGPKYKKGLLGGVEGMCADICKDCGSLTQLPLRETNHKWD